MDTPHRNLGMLAAGQVALVFLNVMVLEFFSALMEKKLPGEGWPLYMEAVYPYRYAFLAMPVVLVILHAMVNRDRHPVLYAGVWLLSLAAGLVLIWMTVISFVLAGYQAVHAFRGF